MSYRSQRVRDPLNNLIEFPADEFHDAMWRVIQTGEFQRLRRIKQLGFSELIYPGATHTRFAHSLGVFHTARKLMKIIEVRLGATAYQESKAQRALAAALVHDLGHGPFSHAFEDAGKRLKLSMADHEKVSDTVIRTGEVGNALNGLGSGFASDVADVIGKVGPTSIYGAVVSSQFDADRLDYIQRDRLMTGTHHGAIDFEWLLSNLEVGKVAYGSDQEKVGEIETFVLGPKALHAAETYLLGLFQLYATVYLHKTTRGAEKLFTELLARVINLARDGSTGRTGLNESHPLIRFATAPDKLEYALALDDSVVGGALSMMMNADDPLISDFSSRLRNRKLFKCLDVRESLSERFSSKRARSRRPKQSSTVNSKAGSSGQTKLEKEEKRHLESLDSACERVEERIRTWADENFTEIPRILIDKPERSIYKLSEESTGPLNKIMMKTGTGAGKPVDVASISKVIQSIGPFKALRVYMDNGDEKTNIFVRQVIEEEGG